jgi:hypothetical protein
MKDDLSKFDLYQLAAKVGKRITNVHRMPIAEVSTLCCYVDGKFMSCVQARKYLEDCYHQAKATGKLK